MKNVKLDLTDFNSSLVEMLTIMKDKGNFIENIINISSNRNNYSNTSDNNTIIEIDNSFQEQNKKQIKEEMEEKVDLKTLKLNIQALRDAVRIAKESRKKTVN